ncbi:hypothetical protein [Pyxidicoccus caerfyrddinensis]|uniref:hypothetical protein n=1 Tax=Pyxidicoccus caerfyrddinensis TaxID=2709663 RepID=UPI0013D92A6F|nr:hypothetical protein [Pyxidicoccus caerfyrddinensis]
MTRGAAVAQYKRPEKREEPLGLRLTKTENEELLNALAEEKKDSANKEMTRTELGQLIWTDGLDLYAARQVAGPERVRALAARAYAGDERALLAEALRRLLESAESPVPEKSAKKGGK